MSILKMAVEDFSLSSFFKEQEKELEHWEGLNKLRTDMLQAIKRHGEDAIVDIEEGFKMFNLSGLDISKMWISFRTSVKLLEKINKDVREEKTVSVNDIEKYLSNNYDAIINKLIPECESLNVDDAGVRKLTDHQERLSSLQKELERTADKLKEEGQKERKDEEESKNINKIEREYAKCVSGILNSLKEVIFALHSYIGMIGLGLNVLKKVTHFKLDCTEAVLKSTEIKVTNRSEWEKQLADARKELKNIEMRIAGLKPA